MSYLIKTCMAKETYTIIGYNGKQVRDQIHAKDLSRAIDEFYKNPKCGAVYNIGGGKANSLSILEGLEMGRSNFRL